MDKLYKITSNGKTQVWYQEISEDGTSYRTVTGKLDGKMSKSEWTKVTPKNVGKANETDLQTQCLLEVASNYTKKLAQGNYKNTLDEEALSQDNYFKPMLAKKYRDDYLPTMKDYADGIVYSQPKLDGVRCIVNKDGMWSRQGKPILGAPHVFEALKPLLAKEPDLVFDGELYCDKLSDNFNKIISLVRQAKPTKEDLAESAKYIQYHVYDFPALKNRPFEQRYRMLASYVTKTQSHLIALVTTDCVFTSNDLDELYSSYMEQGYEGQMVRISSEKSGYDNKRSKQLLKRKEFKDDEFLLVDIEEGIGNRSGRAGAVLCQDNRGKRFRAGIKGNWEFAESLLRDKQKYLGTVVTVQYQDLTPGEHVPRFGVAVKFHGTTKREL